MGRDGSGGKSWHLAVGRLSVCCITVHLQGQPVAWWLSYLTWTHKVGRSIPGEATIRSAQLLGP